MEYAAGPPSRWLVTLKDGSTIEVWADVYCVQEGQYQFESFMKASLDEQRHVRVTAASRQPSSNVVILIARVPASLVESIEGGPVDVDEEAELIDASE